MGTSSRVGSLVREAVDAVLGEFKFTPPDCLYHYTTSAGLYGIVKTGGIFLSDTRFLNDSSEIEYGRHAFLNGLRRLAAAGSEPRADDALREFERLIENRSVAAEACTTRVLVASFCATGNLLSQWRAYGSSSGSYSLGFRSKDLLETVTLVPDTGKGSPVQLRRVLYDPDEQQRLIDVTLTRVFTHTSSVNHLGAPRYIANSLFHAVTASLAPQIKSPVFREEEEWRLVCATSACEFRVTPRGIVPYVLGQVGKPSTAGGRVLPIDRVYVGPCQQFELARTACSELLRASGMTLEAETVMLSDVPLRP
jgi:hypothetical protein